MWPPLAALLLLTIAGIASSAESEYGHQLLRTVADPVPVPELRLPDLAGDLVELDGLEGRVILVNFWATWCPPCRKEMPALARLAQHFQGEAFEVVGVNVGESVERIQDFLQTLPVLPDFLMLLDPDGSVSQAWHARVVPTTVVVDRYGHIVLRAVGEVDFDSPDLRGQLQALMPGFGGAEEGNGTAPAP